LLIREKKAKRPELGEADRHLSIKQVSRTGWKIHQGWSISGKKVPKSGLN